MRYANIFENIYLPIELDKSCSVQKSFQNEINCIAFKIKGFLIEKGLGINIQIKCFIPANFAFQSLGHSSICIQRS